MMHGAHRHVYALMPRMRSVDSASGFFAAPSPQSAYAHDRKWLSVAGLAYSCRVHAPSFTVLRCCRRRASYARVAGQESAGEVDICAQSAAASTPRGVEGRRMPEATEQARLCALRSPPRRHVREPVVTGATRFKRSCRRVRVAIERQR